MDKEITPKDPKAEADQATSDDKAAEERTTRRLTGRLLSRVMSRSTYRHEI